MVSDSIYEQIAYLGKVDEALDKCQKDISSFENSNSNLEYADGLHAMASILKFYKSEYKKALDYLELEIQVRLLHNLPNIDLAYLKSAILNSYLDRKELVINYVKLTLENTKNENIKAVALNVIGDTLFKANPDQSEKYYREAEQLFITTKDEYNLSHVLLSIARLEGFKGNIDVALSICEQELDKGNKSQNSGILGTTYLRFAEIYSFNNEFKKSGAYAKKAYTIGTENNWEVLKLEAERLMTK
jgi:tetratricopeptide (TPR) repeat protein